MELKLIPHKSRPGRKLFMERLDPATHSHILEETPNIPPRDATQWISEGGVPVITHGCKSTSGGEGEYEHKWYEG